MAKDELKISVRNVVEKLAYALIIALVIFMWRLNAKVNIIADNKESIGKLWQQYGRLDSRLDDMNHMIGELKGRHTQ